MVQKINFVSRYFFIKSRLCLKSRLCRNNISINIYRRDFPQSHSRRRRIRINGFQLGLHFYRDKNLYGLTATIGASRSLLALRRSSHRCSLLRFLLRSRNTRKESGRNRTTLYRRFINDHYNSRFAETEDDLNGVKSDLDVSGFQRGQS